MWNEISHELNFTFWIKTSPDGLWAKRFDNGTWLGLFGMLQRNEVEFLIGPTLTLERTNEFDYTLPILESP